MSKSFVEPKLDQNQIEFRFADGEVSLYFNRDGLERLITLMRKMSDGAPNHLHLQDYNILTPDSLPAVLGFFKEENQGKSV